MRALLNRLPSFLRDRLDGVDLGDAREIRVRVGGCVEIRNARRSLFAGEAVTQSQMNDLVSVLTGHSVYAREAQMREGYFTMEDGWRVGLAGRYGAGLNGPLQAVTSACIRVSRRVSGAADTVYPFIADGRARSALILSPPCMGKTTMLREAVYRLSCDGYLVAVADERGELTGDLGPRTDVSTGCEKDVAIMRLIRSLSPDVVATDEVGRARDADAIEEAARCGVAVLATAHARDVETARKRACLRRIVDDGVFERFIELGGEPGRVLRVADGEGRTLWPSNDGEAR